MNEHHGRCHCGEVQLVLRDSPVEAAECNCSICQRTAGIWHYCSSDAVTVTGHSVGYQQGDRAIDLRHCSICGCTTHWVATDPGHPQMGVNLRMFDRALWRDLPRRLVDGANY